MRWISLLCFLFMVLCSFGQEQTLYWIGGAGNWDDISHWSFQSGSQSAELPSSIPTSTTHVVFDAASGFTGTGNVASRKVIVRTNGNVYKSLTFMPDLNATNSPIITNINDYSMRVLGNVTLQAYVWIDFVNNGSFTIDVPINETYNLILNGISQTGKLSRFSKNGEGKLVVEGILGGQTIGVNAGILEYLGSQFNNCTLSAGGAAHVLIPNITQLTSVNLSSNDNSEILLPVTTQLNNVRLVANGNSQILIPNCTTILGANSSLTLNNTSLIDLHLCESFTGNSISLGNSSKLNFSSCSSISLGSNFVYSSNVALNLTGLENLYINTMHGNGNSLLMPNLLIANAGSWNYIGGLTAGVAEFIVRNGRFDTKEGTVVNKVTIKNPKNSICYLSGFNSTINHLIFENSGAAFNNSMNFGNLNLAAGVTYNFISTGTYNISESINLNVPDCTSYTKFITSSEAQATIKNNTSSAIQLVNLMSENINYSGSNLINITGVDNGFNSGNVIFSEPIAKTIYWVGDANDNQWNNITNWALQSGGIGGTCIPSPFDTVIFDENSVILNQNLIISNGDAYVHNLIIEADAPVFNIINQGAVANSIFCYGSWTMRSGISVRAITRFVSKDLSETITSNSSTFDIVVFRGLGGWVLQDDFQIRNNGSYHLYLRGGILDTNGKNVFIGGNFIGNETGINNFFTRTLLLRSSTISVNNQWLFNFTGNILDAGTSHLILREGVTFVSNNAHEYYNITKNGYNNMNFNSVLKANIIKCYNSNLTFNGNLITNELRFYSNTISWLYLNESSTIQSTLEIPKSSFLLVGNNRTLTLNGDLISNTPDCVALSTIAPTSLLPTDRFFLKSANDIFIPNVWMLGVHADTSTGASYTATGFDDENNQNFTFTDQTAKDLYWIGT